MGGTELASFSILVIQQPLEGSKALPLAQGVENPREEPRVEQRCLVGTDTASQQHGVANRQGRTPHTNLRATSTSDPTQASLGTWMHIMKDSKEQDPSLFGYMTHTWRGRLPPPPPKGHIPQFLFYIFNLSLLDLPTQPMPGWCRHGQESFLGHTALDSRAQERLYNSSSFRQVRTDKRGHETGHEV